VTVLPTGLPLVVTDVGGNAEAVHHNQNGLVVPSKDPTTLSTALNKLIHDAPLRTSFGQHALQLYKEQFTVAHCVTQYTAFYHSLLTDR